MYIDGVNHGYNGEGVGTPPHYQARYNLPSNINKRRTRLNRDF